MTFMSIKYQFLKKNRMVQKIHSYTQIHSAYNDNDVIRPLFIKFPQMTGYVKKFEDNTKLAILDQR